MNKEATAARIAENQISREAASAMWGSGSAYRRQMLSTPVPCPLIASGAGRLYREADRCAERALLHVALRTWPSQG
ncbi:hypothetical protein CDO25_22070 (plasmid) [Sinorhizobium meliloti]|nr:hypothetical protein CDO25_22070 [Sinorhizobium meliloti]